VDGYREEMARQSAPEDESDPGWSAALRPLAWFVIPGVGGILFRKYHASHPSDGLTLLRSVFLAFAAAVVLIGAVVAILVTVANFRGGTLSAFPVAIGVVVLGVVGLVARERFEGHLDCLGDRQLAASYRERFFRRIAFAQTASLAGFAGFVLTSRWWLYPLGTIFTVVGYARLAPTVAHLSDDQVALGAGGCDRSLVAALAGLPLGRNPRGAL
jgi:hypothetical protein